MRCDQPPQVPAAKLCPPWRTDCILKLWAEGNSSFLNLLLLGFLQNNEESNLRHQNFCVSYTSPQLWPESETLQFHQQRKPVVERELSYKPLSSWLPEGKPNAAGEKYTMTATSPGHSVSPSLEENLSVYLPKRGRDWFVHTVLQFCFCFLGSSTIGSQPLLWFKNSQTSTYLSSPYSSRASPAPASSFPADYVCDSQRREDP